MPNPLVQQRNARDGVIRIAQKAIRNEQEFTTGLTVEPIRTKEFPEDALPGQPTQISFVVNVRLTDQPGHPLVQDVLVTNQARQLVADEAQVPVQLRKDATGRLMVVGRSGAGADDATIDYYAIHDLDGHNLAFLYGLQYTTFGDLPASTQALITAYRATLGFTALVPTDGIYIDPIVYVHGEDYVQGYIPITDSVRGSLGGSLTVQQTTELVPWTDAVWRWNLNPVGYSSSVSSWGLRRTITNYT